VRPGQLAALEGQLKCTIKLAPLNAAPGGGIGGIDGGDGECAVSGGRTLRAGRGLGVGSNSSHEAGSNEGLHFQMFGRVGSRY
jgi:hypothetical protein